MRNDAYLLRARVALAAARVGTAHVDRLLRGAARDARVLGRQRRPDATANALLIRAGIAAVRGQKALAAELLAGTVEGYERAGMPLCAAYARRRLGTLAGGRGAGHGP